MDSATIKGLSFGLTSGIITTLGMMIGLYASTASRMVVIGGILCIAIADSLSDALGIHISEESEKKKSNGQVWSSTIATLIAKFVFSIAFIIPVLIFDLHFAISISAFVGIILLGVLSYIIAVQKKENPIGVVTEHLVIAIIVIAVTYFVGRWVALVFG